MLILGIESSCDETGAAIIKGKTKSEKVELLSNTVASSLIMHSKTGGIIPENAAREQVKYIIPVIKESLDKAKLSITDLDAISVTYGPGLIGSLLIGVETAKSISYATGIPIIPANHLYGHIYANWISHETNESIEFPAIGLIVSGGHTDLILIKNHGDITWLGGTRDDAAGEALDKIGRLLNLPYPGGPHIEKLAKAGDPRKYNFPKPLIGSKDYDFSFSGLKTAVLREVNSIKNLNEEIKKDLCASVQRVIIEILVRKTLNAAKEFNARTILIGGGVAANSKLREELESSINDYSLKTRLAAPPKYLCTDNGAMIAATAFYNDQTKNFTEIDANPNLYFD